MEAINDRHPLPLRLEEGRVVLEDLSVGNRALHEPTTLVADQTLADAVVVRQLRVSAVANPDPSTLVGDVGVVLICYLLLLGVSDSLFIFKT